jgi:hypothetical protein
MTNTYEHLDIVTNQEAVEQFVERLATFDLADWLSVAASVTQTGHTAGSRANASASLDRVIAHHSLAYDAWSIGDDVETAFHCGVSAIGGAPSPRDCLSLSIARQAATRAALALFVRRLLAPGDFESLYRPFVALVPQPAGSASRRQTAARPPIRLVDPAPRRSRHGTA